MRIYLRSSGFNYDWYSLMRSYLSFVSKDANVLEIGASRVERTRELADFCNHVLGVELVPDRTPADFSNVHYVNGDWQELSTFVDKCSIDVAVASHVVEHVPDDLRAIDELYEILTRTGVAILNTPNRERLTRAVMETFTGERRFPHWEHQREYVEADIERLLEASLFRKWRITPVVLGVHGGPLFVYCEKVPRRFRRFANYWEVHLFKETC